MNQRRSLVKQKRTEKENACFHRDDDHIETSLSCAFPTAAGLGYWAVSLSVTGRWKYHCSLHSVIFVCRYIDQTRFGPACGILSHLPKLMCRTNRSAPVVLLSVLRQQDEGVHKDISRCSRSGGSGLHAEHHPLHRVRRRAAKQRAAAMAAACSFQG